jgi:hypothetical protein
MGGGLFLLGMVGCASLMHAHIIALYLILPYERVSSNRVQG